MRNLVARAARRILSLCGEHSKVITVEWRRRALLACVTLRSEEHTSELQSQSNLVCRLLLEKKNHLTQESPAHRLAARQCFAHTVVHDQAHLIAQRLIFPRLHQRRPIKLQPARVASLPVSD